MREIRVGSRTLRRGVFDRPYFIAEAGVNHEGSMERAKQMVEEVARAGADAIKFQAYKAEKLASKDAPAYWDTRKEPTTTQYELFKKHDQFGRPEFEELADHASHNNLDFLATPFDLESVEFLSPLVPAFKVASADITTRPLLIRVAEKGKPVFLSTGAATVSEIRQAVDWMHAINDQLVIMHCVLSYPTAYTDARLGAIKHLAREFEDHVVGYSDHTLAEHARDVLPTAWLLGAQVIEKHYTWNRDLPGNDHYHALDFEGLQGVLRDMDRLREGVGAFRKERLPVEETARKYARRSLVARRRIPKGKTIEEEDLTWKRPGTGIPPSMMEAVVGGVSLTEIQEDEVLTTEKVRLVGESQPDGPAR